MFGKNLIHSKIIGNIFKGQNPVICDIGTGTGFLAAVCAKHLHPTELIITDTRKSAVELAMHNVKSNSSPDCKLIDLVGFGLTPILAHIKSKVDAILLTPPYIPIYNKSLNHRSEVYSNVLLEQVLLDFHHLSKHLILLISSVANAEYQEAISRSSSRLSIIEIDYKWVPFRVSIVEPNEINNLVNRALLLDIEAEPDKIMIDENDFNSIVQDNRGYRYWHRISLKLITV